jgi:hypothetical protein
MGDTAGGARQKLCSTCQKPCKGHDGPFGKKSMQFIKIAACHVHFRVYFPPVLGVLKWP